MLGTGLSDALRQFVTLADTKGKSGFWARGKECPRSDLKENRTLTHLQIKHTSLQAPNLFRVLRRVLYLLRHISYMKGRSFWLKTRIYTT